MRSSSKLKIKMKTAHKMRDDYTNKSAEIVNGLYAKLTKTVNGTVFKDAVQVWCEYYSKLTLTVNT